MLVKYKQIAQTAKDKHAKLSHLNTASPEYPTEDQNPPAELTSAANDADSADGSTSEISINRNERVPLRVLATKIAIAIGKVLSKVSAQDASVTAREDAGLSAEQVEAIARAGSLVDMVVQMRLKGGLPKDKTGELFSMAADLQRWIRQSEGEGGESVMTRRIPRLEVSKPIPKSSWNPEDYPGEDFAEMKAKAQKARNELLGPFDAAGQDVDNAARTQVESIFEPRGNSNSAIASLNAMPAVVGPLNKDGQEIINIFEEAEKQAEVNRLDAQWASLKARRKIPAHPGSIWDAETTVCLLPDAEEVAQSLLDLRACECKDIHELKQRYDQRMWMQWLEESIDDIYGDFDINHKVWSREPKAPPTWSARPEIWNLHVQAFNALLQMGLEEVAARDLAPSEVGYKCLMPSRYAAKYESWAGMHRACSQTLYTETLLKNSIERLTKELREQIQNNKTSSQPCAWDKGLERVFWTPI